MARKTSAIDIAASGNQKKHKLNQPRSNQTMPVQPDAGVGSDSATSDSPTGEDPEGASSENAEADNQEGNDRDTDVPAPSDTQLDPGKGQAGHTYDSNKLVPGNIEESDPEDASSSRPSNSLHVQPKPIAATELPKYDINSDDDDDYNGVDLISESGDEGPAVEHIEEKAIIASEEDDIGFSLPLSPPNSPSFSISSADFANPDLELSPWLAEDPFFAEQINLLQPYSFATDTDYYGHDHGLNSVNALEDEPRRRVRFAEPLMRPSKTEATASLQSDDATAPPLQSSSIKSTEDDLQSAGLTKDTIGSYFEGHATSDRSGIGLGRRETPFEGFDSADNGDAASSAGSSSGYETDQGETTDEEDVPASATTRPSALLRHSSSDLNNRLARQPLPRAPSSKLLPGHRWGPTLGSWVADPTKPIAVVASSGKQLIVYPAQRPASKGGKVFPTIGSSDRASAQANPRMSAPQLDAPSRPPATEESDVERSEKSSQGAATPMLSASSNLMMSGLGLGGGNLLSGHALGPPEAFFPFHSIGADGKMVLDSVEVDDDDDDDDDGEDLLNIEDFIDFGEDSDDSDHDAGSCSESPKIAPSDQTDAEGTPTASPSAQSSSRSLFDHLNRGKVTAFRRNQHEPDTSIYRPSSSSSSFQVPSPIKTNAFVAASAFNPLKKRKLSSDLGPSVANSAALAKRRMLSSHSMTTESR
ncbi:MAG: hypothetical protein LQ348_007483 [Seirophora lacunosa]|nr:MAG: hypothetical protein LQ348_007483 [Seirophora lacunosa]